MVTTMRLGFRLVRTTDSALEDTRAIISGMEVFFRLIRLKTQLAFQNMDHHRAVLNGVFRQVSPLLEHERGNRGSAVTIQLNRVVSQIGVSLPERFPVKRPVRLVEIPFDDPVPENDPRSTPGEGPRPTVPW